MIPKEKALNLDNDTLFTPDIYALKQEEANQMDVLLGTLRAGFWPRCIAFLIDNLVLAIPFLLFGLYTQDMSFSLGWWEHALSYSLAVLYWGVANSKIHAGQTIGKRIMNIAVVDQNNKFLTLRHSFARAALLSLIFLLSGWTLPMLQNLALAVYIALLIFGGFPILLWIVFNFTTRQGIHDRLVGSHVINL